jgi:hypothetical protein
MTKKIIRYFNANGKAIVEGITFIQAGTSGAKVNDIRAIRGSVLGRDLDSDKEWIPISFSNPSFIVPRPDTIMSEMVTIQLPEGGLLDYQRVVKCDLTTLPNYNPYDEPLLPGWVEISRAEYDILVLPK